ncbi:pre-mRNA-splicing factor 38B-like [Planococcus citri]|uniref:pre-mRNA-splicing factor 38B-like n=1 Tax=Planococcus citri TaxID=170843 RepID=UPI0031F84940
MDEYDEGKYDEKEEAGTSVHHKKNNVLPLWGNERSMNLNPLILTNIQSSHYFKVNLYELKTYHEVIDEIYYKVSHLEPWEKGSRKTAGQTGMCGGVRGVGAGGIVSTAFCLLYKLFTLKLTRKQVIGLITHPDSPYIRVLGFMYIRYTQPPADLWDWYEPYLDDAEELDVKAGGGQIMTIGNILKNFLCKLEWFSTLFPRIPVPIQQKLERKMNERYPPPVPTARQHAGPAGRSMSKSRHSPEDNSKYPRPREVQPSADRDRSSGRYSRNRSSSVERTEKYSEKKPDAYEERSRDRSPNARNGHRSSSRDRYRGERDRYRERRHSPERHRHRSPKPYSEYKDDRYRSSFKYDHERKCADDYEEEKKYKTDPHDKSRRKSYSPDSHRSHKSKKEKYRSSYKDDDYERHRSDRRKYSEERDYEDETSIKKSKYA